MSAASKPLGILLVLLALGSATQVHALTEESAGGQVQKRAVHRGKVPHGALLRGGQPVREFASRFARTYRRADGNYVTRLSSRPVNYRDKRGRWHAIDNRFVRANNKLRNRANRYRLQLPSQLDDAPLRASMDGSWLTMRLRNSRGTAEASGAAVRYRRALPDATLQYRAEGDALKEEIVLEGRRAPSRLVFDIRASAGLRARTTADSGVAFLTNTGKRVFALAPSFMYAVTGSDRRPRSVPSRLEPTAHGWTLTLSPDRQWVTERLRSGPVVVDPTVVFGGASLDCTIEDDTPDSTFCTDSRLYVGFHGDHDHRTLLKYDIDGALPRDAVVLNADFGMFRVSASHTAETKELGVYRVTKPWTEDVTWNRYDSSNRWSTPGADVDPTPAATTTPPAPFRSDWVTWYPTKLVQGWVDGSLPNYGLLVKDVTGGVVNEFGFDSTEQGGTTRGPELDILWAPRTGVLDTYAFDTQRIADGSLLRVNVGNGNLVLQSVEAPNLQVSPGPPDEEVFSWHANSALLSASRFMNSLDAEEGAFGVGSRLGSGTDVRLSPLPDGSRLLRGPSGYQVVFLHRPDGSYESPPELRARLTSNPDGTELLSLPNGDSLTFDAWQGGSGGYLISWMNASGASAIYDRDRTMNLSVTDPGSYLTSFTNLDERLATLTTTEGNHAYGYNGDHTLRTHRGPDGAETRYDYEDGRLSRVIPPSGNQWRVEYDLESRVAEVVEITDPATGAGRSTGYSYRPGATTVTYPGGMPMTYEVDEASLYVGTITSGSSPPTVDLGGALPAAAPDLAGNATYDLDISVNDANGVDHVMIRVDGAPEDTIDRPCGTATSCQLPNALTLDTGEHNGGKHVVEIVVGDGLQSERVRRLVVNVPTPTFDPVPDDPVQDPLSPEEIARATAFRSTFGLPTDEAHVRAVQANPDHDSALATNSVRLTPTEQNTMWLRRQIEEASDAIDEYGGQHADEYAELYISSDNIVHVGFTRNQDAHLAELRRIFAYPDRVQVFPAQRNRADLDALADRIEADDADLRANGIDMTLLGESVENNQVQIGVNTPTSEMQQYVTGRYGNGVQIIQADPVELAQASRALFQRPLVGGLRIGSAVTDCTSGFGAAGDPQKLRLNFRGIPLPDQEIALRALIFTAGHCANERDDDKWSQGGKEFGKTRAWNIFNGTAADAMVISLKPSFVSPWVYYAKHYTGRVDVRKVNVMRRLRNDDVGLEVCFSGAVTRAWRCGSVTKVRERLPVTPRPGAQRIWLRAQRELSIPCKRGDSGAPVVRHLYGDRVEAVGIVSAISGGHCYYTHMEHAINILRSKVGNRLAILVSPPPRNN